MTEWFWKNQLPIGIGLTIFIIVGGIVLLFEEQRDKLLANTPQNVEKAAWDEEKTILTEKINEQDVRIKSLEAGIASGAGGASGGQVAGASTTKTSSSAQSAAISGVININTADLNTLDSLPGIGAVKAQAIIDYRQAHGGFKTIEQLKDVKGIGDSTFNKLKGSITVK